MYSEFNVMSSLRFSITYATMYLLTSNWRSRYTLWLYPAFYMDHFLEIYRMY